MGVDWGSVPDWLAGVGAVAALVFAAIAALATRSQLRELRAENEQNHERERRQLAVGVTVYISTRLVGEKIRPVVWLINSGGLPIYGLTVYCFTRIECLKRDHNVNGPHAERVELYALTRRLVAIFESQDPSEAIANGELVSACCFRDASGEWWYRTIYGDLRPAPDAASAYRGASESGRALFGSPDFVEVGYDPPAVRTQT